MTTEKRLEATDYAVFGTLTIAGYLVGLYFSIPRNSTREGGIEAASLGGRSLPTAALAVSVMASAANSLSVVSFVGHYYAHGFNLMWVLAGIPPRRLHHSSQRGATALSPSRGFHLPGVTSSPSMAICCGISQLACERRRWGGWPDPA
ncbi:hypothetical protein MRX96_027572 [Rhipicephalus microplus]